MKKSEFKVAFEKYANDSFFQDEKKDFFSAVSNQVIEVESLPISEEEKEVFYDQFIESLERIKDVHKSVSSAINNFKRFGEQSKKNLKTIDYIEKKNAKTQKALKVEKKIIDEKKKNLTKDNLSKN